MPRRPTTTALLAAGALALASGCGAAASSGADSAAPPAAAACEQAGPLCWYHDDYGAALADARTSERPLVIDMWAPWCHTCLSMQHYVFTDPSLATIADRFVWLAIDTDRPENAAVVGRLPVRAWPTLFVLGPADESVQARFQGAASSEQLRAILAEGEQAYLDDRAARGRLAADDPSALARRGDRLALAGDLGGAAAAYEEALSRAPRDWPRRPDVLVSRIGALANGERFGDCADLGLAALDHTGSSASAADFGYYAMVCAERLAPDDARRRKLLGQVRARLAALVDDPSAPLSLDDRSDALRILRDTNLALGDAGAAQAIAERQRRLLDRAAAEAPSPAAAATYNWPRAEVYVYLERGAELIPELERSAAALPDDYDPPYRIAWVALQTGDLERARAAAERALELVYGPRKGRALGLLADIHAARGDPAAEREARAAAVTLYEHLPEGQRQPAAEQQARAALAALDE